MLARALLVAARTRAMPWTTAVQATVVRLSEAIDAGAPGRVSIGVTPDNLLVKGQPPQPGCGGGRPVSS
jgi:hypothetical protein